MKHFLDDPKWSPKLRALYYEQWITLNRMNEIYDMYPNSRIVRDCKDHVDELMKLCNRYHEIERLTSDDSRC